MIVKKLYTLKKPYIPPRIFFEELEEDGLEMLMDSLNSGGNSDPEDGEGDDDPTPPGGASALDLDFSMDFVINDEPQL